MTISSSASLVTGLPPVSCVRRMWRHRDGGSARRRRHRGPPGWRSAGWRLARRPTATAARRAEARAIRWQERQRDPVRHGQVLGSVPARVVEHEHDVAFAPCASLLREAGEQGLEEGLAQAVGQEPDRLAAGRLDEGRDVQPLVAVVAQRRRPLADGPSACLPSGCAGRNLGQASPTRGGGSASGRGGAHPRPRPRLAGRGAALACATAASSPP